ncbi:MIP family Ig-specific serine endopeptidase [Mycoplasma suis]|uniref:DUF31 domain-containing protein n=1 Tax=Mycoplasma suis (strain Illinois) TaxID=768700 RepID=F0QS32_MYCSL|nr:hypothetical protein [Mycoplasma suis]ADX98302.1 conserved hypothetical protein [Mycoplasma suis str. Illinois]
MPIFPLLANGIKLFLVLGVGLGGHQIYGVVSGKNFMDDGYFYHLDKMSSNEGKAKLGENKVYNQDSVVDGRANYMYSNDWKEHHAEKVDFHKDWGFTNRMRALRESNYEQESNIYKLIKDHTLKLVMPCQSGTGWLLDFELPQNGKYPTRWFIATNLHVINKFVFKDNPYGASLPITEASKWTHLPSYYSYSRYLGNGYKNYLDSCQASIYNKTSELRLFTEEDVNDREHNDLGNQVSHYYQQNNYNYNPLSDFLGGWNNWSSFNNWSSIERFQNQPRIYTTTVKDPKLVYSAVNFLGPRYTVSGHQVDKEDYFKDFGVLEVNFENEKQAKLITNKVFDKYYKDKLNGNQQVSQERRRAKRNIQSVNLDQNKVNYIDFFAPELMSKYTPQQLAEGKDNFFIGGYPGSVEENLSFSMNQKFKVVDRGRYYSPNYWSWRNYNDVITAEPTKSKLTYFKNDRRYFLPTDYNLTNSKGGIIPGHADLAAIDRNSDSSKINWNGKELSGWGYNYLINNTFLGSGASGSMVLDQTGALLGLYRMYNPGLNYGFVEPVRGSWVVEEKTGKVILPGFDLIAGTGKNVVSYRTQMEKRFNSSLKTYLSSKNWNLKQK